MKIIPTDEWETPCPKREDKQHCNCWYDGEVCCGCGDGPADPEQLARDQGDHNGKEV